MIVFMLIYARCSSKYIHININMSDKQHIFPSIILSTGKSEHSICYFLKTIWQSMSISIEFDDDGSNHCMNYHAYYGYHTLILPRFFPRDGDAQQFLPYMQALLNLNNTNSIIYLRNGGHFHIVHADIFQSMINDQYHKDLSPIINSDCSDIIFVDHNNSEKSIWITNDVVLKYFTVDPHNTIIRC